MGGLPFTPAKKRNQSGIDTTLQHNYLDKIDQIELHVQKIEEMVEGPTEEEVKEVIKKKLMEKHWDEMNSTLS